MIILNSIKDLDYESAAQNILEKSPRLLNEVSSFSFL